MIETKLAQYVSELSLKRLEPEVIHLIKRNILDSYAGICSALQDKEMLLKFDRLASTCQAEQGIYVWGIHRKANATEAIFMNTILGRRMDLLNTYMSPGRMGGSHPSDNVSLVLSLSGWLGKNGREVIMNTFTAFLLSCAFADYYYPEKNHYDHDAQALFYLPLVIGSIIGLSVRQLMEAQRIAGMMGLDINQAGIGEVTDWKHCTFASCALRATHAVNMALAGFEGPKEIYEGEAGINRFITHGERILVPPPDLGSIIFKQWPALVFCQTPIDVAVEIAARIEDLQAIEQVEVLTYKKAIREGAIESSYHPTSRAGRTHSIPYCVAAALVRKTIEYYYFDDDFLENEKEVAALLRKIKITEDAQMTRKFPEGAPCKIIITLKNGTALEHFRDFPHGDPREPLSDQEIENKATKNLLLLTDQRNADTIVKRVWDLEIEPNVDWLLAPLEQQII